MLGHASDDHPKTRPLMLSRLAFTLQIGVGIGAAAAVAATVYAFVAYPLPFPSSRAIVHVHNRTRELGPLVVTDQQFDSGWLRMTGPFERIAGFATGAGPLVPMLFAGPTDSLRVCAVAGDLFGVLGIQPRLGRTISANELQTNARVAVITETVWKARFSSQPEAVGLTIHSDRGPYTVVGVVEDRFVFPAGTEAWVPRVPYTGQGRYMALAILARLRKGWTVSAATSAVASLVPPSRPGDGRPSVRLVRLVDEIQDGARKPVFGAALIAGLVLIGVGINLLHLSVARGMVRRREQAVRLALGAGVAALRRMAMLDSAASCAPGTLIACVVACGFLRLVLAVTPRSYYYVASPSVLDVAAIGFSLLMFVALASVLAFAQVQTAVQSHFASQLKSGTRAVDGMFMAGRVGRVLISSQVSLSVALVVMALAFTRSYSGVASADLGYQWRGLITFQVSLPYARYPDADARARVYDSLFERLRTLPFVRDAEATSKPLLSDTAGESIRAAATAPKDSERRAVTPGLLQSIGVRLLEGRHLHASDRGLDVAVVNAEYARTFLRGVSAVGRQVPFNPARTIVGVVDDIRDTDAAVTQVPVAYLPMTGTFPSTQVVIGVRPGAVADYAAIRRVVSGVDSETSVVGFQTMAERVESALAPWRARAFVVSLAGAITLLVLCVGLLAALLHAVTIERHALAVRLAMGARGGDLAAHLRRAFRLPLLAGGFIGMWGAWVLLSASASWFDDIGVANVLDFAIGATSTVVPTLLLPIVVARQIARVNIRAALQGD